MNAVELLARVRSRFPEATELNDGVIQVKRVERDKPFAVYYFSVPQTLPKDQRELDEFQRIFVAPRFFELEPNLQWNSYFYLVTAEMGADLLQKYKGLIESDRTYARKFVLAESELDNALLFMPVSAADDDPAVNVLSIWLRHLQSAGLYQAVVSDDDLPHRLQYVLSAEAGASVRPLKTAPKAGPEPFLAGIELQEYRDFPTQRHFTFGDVNLLIGPNAAGKTSLLEAIELYYCGRTLRDRNGRPPYRIAVETIDGKVEVATHNRKLQIFRDRNLLWYGQAEEKTNDLYQSFSRFNFLNTDAAVEIATSTASINDNLAKLLIGPDASRIWRNAEKLRDFLRVEIKRARDDQSKIEDSLADARKRLRLVEEFSPSSQTIQPRLRDLLRHWRWRYNPPGEEAPYIAEISSSLSEMLSLVDQLLALEWLSKPVSVDSIDEFIKQTKNILQHNERALAELQDIVPVRTRDQFELVQAKSALTLIEQIRPIIAANIPALASEKTELLDAITHFNGLLAGLAPLEAKIPEETLRADLESAYGDVVLLKTSSITALGRAEETYAGFLALRERTLKSLQELRRLAAEIVDGVPEKDTCPLCHTEFARGELAAHIQTGVDHVQERTGQVLLAQIAAEKGKLRAVEDTERYLKSLIDFQKRSQRSPKGKVKDAVDAFSFATQELQRNQARLKEVTAQLDSAQSSGMSISAFNEIVFKLNESGFSFEPTVEGVSALASTLATKADEAKANIEVAADIERRAIVLLSDSFPGTSPIASELRKAHLTLADRLGLLVSTRSQLERLFDKFPWPRRQALLDFVPVATTARSLASELHIALITETQNAAVVAEAKAESERLKGLLDDLLSKTRKLANAHTSLTEMAEKYSLEGAISMALERSRKAIETIFTLIHSPREFAGFGQSLSTLVRKEGGRTAELHEISTGQRAAFALSIFLSQNAQLRAGPPVMLIDDPVAHIDDLNSLSFLDYLRELVLDGQRQIFFATANGRIAGLFERKFSFLGDRFKKITLDRALAAR